jgi:hypothetical protein
MTVFYSQYFSLRKRVFVLKYTAYAHFLEVMHMYAHINLHLYTKPIESQYTYTFQRFPRCG